MKLEIGFRGFAIVAVCWIIFLTISALYHPTSFNSDPGYGFFDLFHYLNGGKFQHHLTPSIEDANKCIEERTTWWTPGQWYFIYMIMKTGIPLGISITLAVLFSVVTGLMGWIRLYRKFDFDLKVILSSALIILFSRYLFTSFQIYPGASILEFAFAPWFILLWIRLESGKLILQMFSLFILILISYFIKSSFIIFWLAAIVSIIDMQNIRRSNWKRFLLLLFVFIAAKYVCDFMFVKGGLTPFNSQSQWFSKGGDNIFVKIQYLLFVLQGPFNASIGMDDYIRYVFQKPGNVILNDGHYLLLILYVVVLSVFILLGRHFYSRASEYNNRYFKFLIAFLSIYIAFFAFAYFSGKSITGYEESRHFRIAGLLLLPLIIKTIDKLYQNASIIVLSMLMIYAIPSYLSKLRRPDLISEKNRIASSITSKKVLNKFENLAAKADLVYVINTDHKYPLDQCKTMYNQDDFVDIETIRNRPDHVLGEKKLLLLLPERFEKSGKKEAILSNFKSKPGSTRPSVSIQTLDGYDLIEVDYH